MGREAADALLPKLAPEALPAGLVIFVLLGVAFTSNVIISLIAPFLPQHFMKIGVSQVWCGAMFSANPLATLFCSPLVVKAMQRFGRIHVLTLGLIVQGVTCLTFGYADDLTGGPGVNISAALTVYLASRLGCGAGSALCNNAIFAMAADRFEDRLGLVVGPIVGTSLVEAVGLEYTEAILGSCIAVYGLFASSYAYRQPPPKASPTEAVMYKSPRSTPVGSPSMQRAFTPAYVSTPSRSRSGIIAMTSTPMTPDHGHVTPIPL